MDEMIDDEQPIVFRVQIITCRNDGCFVDVRSVGKMLEVNMVSKSGEHVTGDTIEPAQLARWIETHHDW